MPDVRKQTLTDDAHVPADAARRPRILFVVPADYGEMKAKGVAPMIADRDEGRFFARVITVHPVAQADQRIELDDINAVEEIRFVRPRWLSREIAVLLAPLHLIKVLYRIRQLIRDEKIDIVRATDPYFMGLIGWLASRFPRRPFCISIHADYDKRFELNARPIAPTFLGSRRIIKWLERFMLRRADLVMPIRDSLVSKAAEAGVPASRICVIPHGIDTALFAAPSPLDIRTQLGIPRDRKIVSFAGRVSRENYVDDVVALTRLLAERRDCVVVMAGGGAEEARLNAEWDHDPALRDTLMMVGFQPRATIVALRQQSAVALCLMGGYSLLESCAAGSPTIAYDVEWHREIITDGETGYLVPEGDLATLHRRVTALLDDLTLVRKISEAASRRVVERHGMAATTAIKRDCYNRLLRPAT